MISHPCKYAADISFKFTQQEPLWFEHPSLNSHHTSPCLHPSANTQPSHYTVWNYRIVSFRTCHQIVIRLKATTWIKLSLADQGDYDSCFNFICQVLLRCYFGLCPRQTPKKTEQTALRIYTIFRLRSFTTSLVFDLLKLPNEDKINPFFPDTFSWNCFFSMSAIQLVIF